MINPTVDIIIPIHNAPQATRVCLSSVSRHQNTERHRVILVDDGSNGDTVKLLNDFHQSHSNTTLLSNSEAQGFTRAANKGLLESTAEIAIVLNSDTETSTNWIEKIATTLLGTTGAGIAGPLSNAASAQSIPRADQSVGERLSRQTPINELPRGMTIEGVNRFLESVSWGPPIRVPLVHGFCFAVKREVFDEIGYFDEVNFPRGYGEENDFCFRATDAGWSHVLVPNTYVWHQKTASYRLSERKILVDQGITALASKYGNQRIKVAGKSLGSTSSYIRSKIGDLSEP